MSGYLIGNQCETLAKNGETIALTIIGLPDAHHLLVRAHSGGRTPIIKVGIRKDGNLRPWFSKRTIRPDDFRDFDEWEKIRPHHHAINETGPVECNRSRSFATHHSGGDWWAGLPGDGWPCDE